MIFYFNIRFFFNLGEKWRQRRKLVNSAFHPSLLKIYVDVVNKNSEAMIKNIKSQGDETVQDLLPLFIKNALKIICGNFSYNT